MDWLHFVRIAHLKLRVQYLASHPEILEHIMAESRPPLVIPRPIELAGMRARLLRAKQLEKDIGITGRAYDEVLNRIEDAKVAMKDHTTDLSLFEQDLRRTIFGMLERSNGGPTDGDSDGRQSPSDHVEQGAANTSADGLAGSAATLPQPSPVADVVADGTGAPASSEPAPPPASITVNGVTTP